MSIDESTRLLGGWSADQPRRKERERERGDMSWRKTAGRAVTGSERVSCVVRMWFVRPVFPDGQRRGFFSNTSAWQPVRPASQSESPIFPNPLEIFISLLAAVAEQRIQQL